VVAAISLGFSLSRGRNRQGSGPVQTNFQVAFGLWSHVCPTNQNSGPSWTLVNEHRSLASVGSPTCQGDRRNRTVPQAGSQADLILPKSGSQADFTSPREGREERAGRGLSFSRHPSRTMEPLPWISDQKNRRRTFSQGETNGRNRKSRTCHCP